jgi:hypothetical protein
MGMAPLCVPHAPLHPTSYLVSGMQLILNVGLCWHQYNLK